MLIKVRVLPKSSRNQVDNEKMADGTLKIRVTAAPEKGKANTAVIKILAQHFGVKPKNVKIIKGETDRNKIVEIC